MLFLFVGWLHVLLAPYTKVEESFNLHAIHDLIFHGPLPKALPNVRHHICYGPQPPENNLLIPESSLALGLVTWTAAFITKTLRPFDSKYELQVLGLVRLTLATINGLGLFQMQRAVTRRFGFTVSIVFVLLTCTQFHIPFWMGRTLPNMFALYPVNVASTFIIAMPATFEGRKRNFNAAIAILTFTVVTLRSELLLLLGPLVLHGLYQRRTTLASVIKTGLISGILSLMLTVSIDSYFWNQWPLWPELSGLYFNVYEGKSVEWGVSPAYSYFVVHLPKLLLSALPLSILGLLVDARVRTLLFPCVAFAALLSCLGHKEWRFIVYTVPIWNIAGARGAAWLLSVQVKGKHAIAIRALFRLALLGCFGLNIFATTLLTQASMANYPGGEGLRYFNNLLERSALLERRVSVHIDNYSAQTGASLFLHEYAPPRSTLVSSRGLWNIIYNKTENLAISDDFREYDWVITEHPDMFLVSLKNTGSNWSPQASVDGLQEVRFGAMGDRGLWTKFKVPRVVRKPKLWLLKQERTSEWSRLV